ncbi:hypothetical protein DBA29_17325 [Xenophilus aerolatus]|nr:hypothetical protein [Xenophilus aerolatus]
MATRKQKHRRFAALEQRGLCIYCCRPMGRDATAEHLRPRCSGGTDRRSNIAAACHACNQARHSRSDWASLSPSEFGFLRLLEAEAGY